MSFFSKLKEGLQRTKENMVLSLEEMFNTYTKVDEGFLEELEDTLIMSDVSMNTAMKISDELKETVKRRHIDSAQQVREEVKAITARILDKGETAHRLTGENPLLILVIGVNGVGKTTSIAKIAAGLKKQGRSVQLVAADTFRAAAAEQLTVWGERIGVNVIRHKEGSDPAAVLFDGIHSAVAKGTDVLICDTAGRLHNKKNLMNELQKMDRIIEREFPQAHRETLLVIDGSTGQNALSQVRQFSEITNITGIILTKLDGTAKGGIVISIADEFSIPVKFIGVGEGLEDMQPFRPDEFVQALFDSAGDEKGEEEEQPLEEAAMREEAEEALKKESADLQEEKKEQETEKEEEQEAEKEEANEIEAQGETRAQEEESLQAAEEEAWEDMEEKTSQEEKAPQAEMAEAMESAGTEGPLDGEETGAEQEAEKEEAGEADAREEEQSQKKGFWSRFFGRK